MAPCLLELRCKNNYFFLLPKKNKEKPQNNFKLFIPFNHHILQHFKSLRFIQSNCNLLYPSIFFLTLPLSSFTFFTLPYPSTVLFFILLLPFAFPLLPLLFFSIFTQFLAQWNTKKLHFLMASGLSFRR